MQTLHCLAEYHRRSHLANKKTGDKFEFGKTRLDLYIYDKGCRCQATQEGAVIDSYSQKSTSRGQRRPLFGLALAYVLGTALALRFSIDPPAAISLGVACLVLAWLLRYRTISNIAIYAAVAALAVSAGRVAENRRAAGSVAGLMRADREYALARGFVAYEPICYPSSDSARTLCYFEFNIDKINRAGDWEAATGRIRVRMPRTEDDPPLLYGDELELQGLLIREDASAGYFTAASQTIMQVSDSGGKLLSRGNGWRLISACLTARAAAAEIVTRGMPPDSPQSGLIQALLLGYREALDSSVHGQFAATGTVHILAISGLHVGLIAWIIVSFLRWTGIPRTRYFIFLTPLLALYTISTGLRSSAIRACLMAVVYWIAPAIKRKPDALCSLSLTAIIILMFAPTQLLDPGFQFSFIIVAGIIAMVPIFNGVGIGLAEPDPMRIQDEKRLVALLRMFGRRIYFLAAITFSSWIISMPLIMYYGNLFSPIALVGNLIVVPLTTIIVGLGALSLILGSFLSSAALLLNQLNHAFLSLLLSMVEVMASVRAGYLNVLSPPLWFFPLYYGAILAAFISQRIWSKLAISALTATLVLLTVLAPRWIPSHMEFSSHGGVNSALLHVRGNSPVLVNTGSLHHSRELRRRLETSGVNTIGILILTQVDSAHAGGIFDVFERYRVDEVWIPDYPSRSPIYAEIVRMETENGLRLRRLHASAPQQIGDGIEFEVFSPRAELQYRNTSAAALVARIAKGSNAVMIVGSDRLPPQLFDQPKDLYAPVWSIESAGPVAHLDQELLATKPAHILLGGSTIPMLDEIRVTGLEGVDSFRIEFE